MYTGALPPRSNKASWAETIAFTDDTGTAFDISSATEISIRLREPETCSVVLEATLTGNTVTIDGPNGTASFAFTASQMGALCPGYYEFGTLVTISDSTEQVHLGTIEILNGL